MQPRARRLPPLKPSPTPRREVPVTALSAFVCSVSSTPVSFTSCIPLPDCQLQKGWVCTVLITQSPVHSSHSTNTHIQSKRLCTLATQDAYSGATTTTVTATQHWVLFKLRGRQSFTHKPPWILTSTRWGRHDGPQAGDSEKLTWAMAEPGFAVRFGSKPRTLHGNNTGEELHKHSPRLPCWCAALG